MPSYTGRTRQREFTGNMLGINARANEINSDSGEAEDISNWDLDISGAIKRRLGKETVHTFAGATSHFDSLVDTLGNRVFVAVNGGQIWEAPDPSGPWVARGGSFTTGDFTYIGDDLNGAYVLCNGVDKPHVFRSGQACITLEDASVLSAPSSLMVVSNTSGSQPYLYVVTASTPRGETIASAVASVTGPPALSSAAYNLLTWVPPAGAFSINIYRFNTTFNAYYRIDQVLGTVTSYQDTGAEENIFTQPPETNTAYNTPEDWNTNGQPEGVFTVSRGKNQRMVAWRRQSYWFSALSNVYDWYSPNDSFTGYVLGGDDNTITAMATLFDYTIIFSRTNAYAYTGSSSADWSLSKIFNTGCPSHYGLVYVGDEAIMWTQLGPSSLRRVLQGADIQSSVISKKISPIVYDEVEQSGLSKIRAFHDVKNQRVCFAFPETGESKNSSILSYHYETKGWTRIDGWEIENTVYSPSDQCIYALMGDNTIAKLASGDTDSGVGVPNHYETVWLQSSVSINSRHLSVDVYMDSSSNYDVSVYIYSRYDDSVPSGTHRLVYNGSTATTDGQFCQVPANRVIKHNIHAVGCSNAIKLRFTDNSVQPARILGWRPDFRQKGLR